MSNFRLESTEGDVTLSRRVSHDLLNNGHSRSGGTARFDRASGLRLVTHAVIRDEDQSYLLFSAAGRNRTCLLCVMTASGCE